MSSLRACLEQDFSSIYCFNLRGNARTKGKVWQKEGDKIFGGGSMLPIAITVFVKNQKKLHTKNTCCKIYYYEVKDGMSRLEKFKALASEKHVRKTWRQITPDGFHDWINQGDKAFFDYVPLSKNDASVVHTGEFGSAPIIGTYYFDHSFAGYSSDGNDSTSYSSLKQALFDSKLSKHTVSESMYRPFEKKWLLHKNNSRFVQYYTKPNTNVPFYNPTICVSNHEDIFSVLMCDVISDYHMLGNTKCFPLYVRNHNSWILNISDSIFSTFQTKYNKPISKIDIFYYIYGILHSPNYRSSYADNLRRTLPHIPIVDRYDDFIHFSQSGKKLAHLHLSHDVSIKKCPITISKSLSTSTIKAPHNTSRYSDHWHITSTHIKNMIQSKNSSQILTVIFEKHSHSKITNMTLKIQGIPLNSLNDESIYTINLWSPLKWFTQRKTMPDYTFKNFLDFDSFLKALVMIEINSTLIISALPKIKFPPFQQIHKNKQWPQTYYQYRQKHKHI